MLGGALPLGCEGMRLWGVAIGDPTTPFGLRRACDVPLPLGCEGMRLWWGGGRRRSRGRGEAEGY